MPCNPQSERKRAFSFMDSANRVHNDEGSGRDWDNTVTGVGTDAHTGGEFAFTRN